MGRDLLPAEDPHPSCRWGWSQELIPWLWGHQHDATAWFDSMGIPTSLPQHGDPWMWGSQEGSESWYSLGRVL